MFQRLSEAASDHSHYASSAGVDVNPELATSCPTVSRSSGRTAVSINQLTTYRQDFRKDAALCRELGLDRIGLWRRKLDDIGIERAATLLELHGVSVSSLSWGGGFTGGNGLTFADAVAETRAAILEAARLQAHALTIVSGGRAGHIHSHVRRLLMNGLAETVDIAAEHGLTLALQPMATEYADEWTFLNSLAESLEIVREFDHPFLGLAVGSYHVWEEPRVLQLLEEAAPFTATVQLSDARSPRHDCDRLAPGDGEIPLAAMVAALQRGGYRGDFEIDVWSNDIWKQPPQDWLVSCTRTCSALVTKGLRRTMLPESPPTRLTSADSVKN